MSLVVLVFVQPWILDLIPRLHIDWSLWFVVVPMWFVFLGGWLACVLGGRWLGWSRERVGSLTLVAGLGNTAFTGYPRDVMTAGSG